MHNDLFYRLVDIEISQYRSSSKQGDNKNPDVLY